MNYNCLRSIYKEQWDHTAEQGQDNAGQNRVDASETVVIHQAHQFLTFNSLFYIPLTIVNVWRFTIQGMGYSLLAILAGVCEMIARALVGFALVPIFGYIIICFASPLAWLMADAFLIPAFYYCLRNLLKAQEMLE